MKFLLRIVSCLSVLASLPARDQGPQTQQDDTTTIAWQRSLADAHAIQKATGLPLLVVANMDGEVFNERFANTTYKDPEFVAVTRGYVCVVFSPDRHTESDYDAFGNRVECPRFPGCTCSEHTLIEPKLYELYFDGRRNAPRHIGVSPEGKILFDRFLDQSMQTAIDAVRKHRGTPKPAATAVPESVAALFARRDAAARRALEARYRTGDAMARKALLTAATKATNEPFDLLRMALRDDDEGIFSLAASALAAVATTDSTIDVEDALARTDDAALTAALLARLRQIGTNEPAIARLANHLATTPRAEALPSPWSGDWRERTFDPADRAAVEAELDRCEAALKQTPDDEETRLRQAMAQAAFAEILIRENGKGIEFWLEDSVRNARRIRGEALQTEAYGLLAYVHHLQNDAEAAAGAARLALAPTAVAAARQPDPWLAARFLATEVVLTAAGVFAKADEYRGKDLRPELERTLAILDRMQARGMATEAAVLAGTGLLEFAGLRREARKQLATALATFPASERVHERWRTRVTIDLGVEAMRRHYATFTANATDAPSAEWFAGYAAIVAAERHTRDRRADVGIGAYTEAVERFTRSGAGNESYLDSANHFVVLALAGRAALRAEKGDADGAIADLLQAAALRPASLDDSDGLQRKPRAIAGRIARELEQQGKKELAAKLQPLLP